ncbi:hypothetical protein FRZ67_03050 [Panacibacter ginsenosidivorans]|uniref:Uncharacterized protein n=1 Tax=Panacibacter ginsenosidivorans TaxID=1813871 RepID=A0A5B8V544_9BACT|nr:hypothetical protein [Panacibacter ginsenosidivorans]QEC66332.1 hypothetical protein FRZ67_03050 [Panacibacter ginsenosidivorans]
MMILHFNTNNRYYSFNVYTADESIPAAEFPTVVMCADGTLNFHNPFLVRSVCVVHTIEELNFLADYFFVLQHKLPADTDLQLFLEVLAISFEQAFLTPES